MSERDGGGRRSDGKDSDPRAKQDPEPEHAPAPRTSMAEVQHRLSGGQQGTGVLDRIREQRRAVGASVVQRMAIMRKAGGAATWRAPEPEVPTTSGSPLPGEVRTKMEPKLGADLSQVRVHTGGESAQAAAGFGARAFAVGSDVHFGAGEFKPGTKEGDQLLAHELTHTVQAQRSGVQRKAEEATAGDASGHQVSQPGEPAEQEADALGDKVAESLHGDGAAKDRAKPEGGPAGAKGHAKDHKDAKASGGADAEEKAAGEHQAPAIGAKLDGVGRKVFLARPPSLDRQMPDPEGVEQRRAAAGQHYGVENRVQPGAGKGKAGATPARAELPANVRSAREVTQWLAQNGFQMARQAGSHQQWRGPTGGMVTVAMHPGDIPAGTLASIRRQIRAAQE